MLSHTRLLVQRCACARSVTLRAVLLCEYDRAQNMACHHWFINAQSSAADGQVAARMLAAADAQQQRPGCSRRRPRRALENRCAPPNHIA